MNLIKRITLTTLLAAGFVVSAKTQGLLQPFNLHCDERTNPLGIGDTTPRLSWQLQSLQTGPAYRGQAQTAYEIQVGTTPGASDLWDSGKVNSAQTISVIYGGQPLTSGQQCFWRVRVYDNNGNASDFSSSAQWSEGLLQPSDWTAQWVGYDAAYNLSPAQATNAALFNTGGLSWLRFPAGQSQAGIEQSLLRKKIVLPASPAITNAIFALYADDMCGVFVNGQRATNSAVRWEATAQINVTALLHAGTNLLALQATNGDAQPASVIGKLVVQFASGSVSNFPVDTSWKAAQTAASNWPQTNFDDSGWTTAESTGTPWGTPSLNDIARVPAPYLRKNFNVGQTVARATVYVTALGAYELHLNGQKVGNDVLTPGWSEFSKRVYYQTYDVTSMIAPGTNVMSTILGDGWYASDLAYKGQRLNYGGTPRFIAQLVIQFSDGSTQTVVTDNSWRVSYGPILYGDLLLGSGYDARQEIPGWDTTNLNATGWSAVMTGLNAGAVGYSNVTALVQGLESNNQLNFVANNTTMGGDPAFGTVKTLQLIAQVDGVTQTNSFAENATVTLGGSGHTLIVIQALYGDAARFPGTAGLQVQAAVTEPSRCFEMLGATNLTQPAPGCYTFDLGQNIAGWAQVNIGGHVGDRVTIRYGEMLNPDGTIYTENLRGATATDFYTFATNGTITYQPRFTFHGFRYVELRGLSVAPSLNSVTGVVVHSDMPLTGSFVCSSPLVNQLYRNIIWGQKGNYLEVPTDCPQRDERMGWTGDTEFFAPTAVYNFDVQSFFHRHLVTLCEDSQHPDGSFANVAPDLGAGTGAAAWGDAAWICTDVIYHAYGDTNVIVDHYASFQKYGQYLAAHASNFTISSLPGDFNDWLNLGGGASQMVIDTAFYAYYAQAMSEMATAIGNTTDAVSYATLHSNIVSAFVGFFNPDGSFKDGSSQTGYALAFTLNLVPSALRSQASQQFASTIAQFNNHLATGFIGTPRLLPALHNAGLDDVAGRILLQQTYPSWLYQVTLGATTMWERWDGWLPSSGFESPTMNSFNHYAFGAVGQYLYGTIGGINAASPGYKSILIQPVSGNGLNWAAASYNSVNGLISTAWTNMSDGTFHLNVVIPPNTTAQIYVPATNANTVFESGVPASSSPGVGYVGFTNNYAIYAVGSGNYFWSSVLPTPPVPPAVAETDSVYLLGNSFPPLPSDDLITNATTSVVSNGLTFANENRAPSTALHDGNIGAPGATNLCSEISGGSITFYLGDGTYGTGFTITNLNTYTVWEDDGRENANYGVTYSADGTNFFTLANVAYNPSPYPTKDGTGGTLTSLSVSNLTGVRYLRWNFSASQQNGGVGYSELAAFGMSSSLPAPILTGAPLVSGNFVVNASGLVPGRNYQIQSTTNLMSAWTVETNFQAAQSGINLTNALTNSPQKFYRVMAQ